jgi:CRP/FNR family transcriptional regulator, cyclic AMP receptor protein
MPESLNKVRQEVMPARSTPRTESRESRMVAGRMVTAVTWSQSGRPDSKAADAGATRAGAAARSGGAHSAHNGAFDALALLDAGGVARKVIEYGRKETIFTQGDMADGVMYIMAGGVKVSVVDKTGKEAVLAVLEPGDFLGEGCLAGQMLREGTATATAHTTVLAIKKDEMARALHAEHGLCDRFLAYMLARNIRVQEDLIDQLLNSSEKRLARTLLLLAGYDKEARSHKMLPRVSQEMLAQMIGTTRPRVNFFMNKFKKLGFIEYNGGIQINSSLLSLAPLGPPAGPSLAARVQ